MGKLRLIKLRTLIGAEIVDRVWGQNLILNRIVATFFVEILRLNPLDVFTRVDFELDLELVVSDPVLVSTSVWFFLNFKAVSFGIVIRG